MDPQENQPPFHELIFVEESTTLLDTAERVHARMLRNLADGKQNEFWEAVDQLLNVAIRVANIYWPSSGNSLVKRRGRVLRAHLELGHGERFPGLRAVRNGFEHLDERIDNWARTTPQIYIDRIVSNGPLGDSITTEGGLDMQRTARSYRTDTGELRVFGASLIVPELMAELRALREHLGSVTGR